jgi:hypothetical protein
MIRELDSAIIEDDIQPRRIFIMQGNRLKVNLVMITGVSGASINKFISSFLLPAMERIRYVIYDERANWIIAIYD